LSTPVVAAAGAYPELIALFNAQHDCATASTLPHPVCARNSKLLAAWRNIESKQYGSAGPLMNTVRRPFYQNMGLLRDTVIHEPLWARNLQTRDPTAADAALVLTTAPLMFWSGRNAIIEPTDALERILVHSDLGDDLSVDMLRPPIPASFIRFGKAFQDAVVPAPSLEKSSVQGVYVFEMARERERVLTLVPIITAHGQRMIFVNTIEIFVNDVGQSLTQCIRDVCEPVGVGQSAHVESVIQIIAKVFLYMSLPQTVRIEERDYSAMHDRLNRIGPKKAAKLQRRLPDLYDRIILGPQEIHVHGHGELSPHLRRGHFRLQPHGPQNSLRKLMFIAPTWVRADKLAVSGDSTR
jgi:hypothetical protein